MIKTCEFCKKEYNTREIEQKFCSVECSSLNKFNYEGYVKILSDKEIVLHSKWFRGKESLKEIMDSFKSSYCIVVSFKKKPPK